MELTVLGCSGSFGAPGGGPCSGYLLRSGDTSIWMDCGNGTFGHLQEHIAVEDLTAVVLTHGHPDHCVDIYGLHVLLRYGIEREGLPVFAPEGLEGFLLSLVSDFGNVFDWRTVGDGDTEKVGDIALKFSRTDHPPPTYAVEARADGRRMIYTADTGPGWSVGAFDPEADLVLSEATYLHGHVPVPIHLSAKQAGEAAREARGPTSHPHAPLAAERSRRGREGRRGGIRRRGDARHAAPLDGGVTLGIRRDGREPDELRPVTFTRDFTEFAAGSVLVEFGRTRVLCTASSEDRIPGWLRGQGRGWVTAEYSMLPGSTSERNQREAARGRLSGRTQEIQRLIGRSLRAVTDLEVMGERQITVDCDVLQADGARAPRRSAVATSPCTTRFPASSPTRRWRAHPMTDTCGAISVGIVDALAHLDLDYSEDVRAEVDMNVVMTGEGRFVEVQGTAEGTPFSRGELDDLVSLAEKGIVEIFGLQREMLSVPPEPRRP